MGLISWHAIFAWNSKATSLCVISLNVRELRSQDKRLKLVNCLIISHKIVVILLQMTHSTPNGEKQWSDQWQGDLYFSHGQQNVRGVCMLTRVSHIRHNAISDNLGRHVMIDLTASDR